MSPQQQRGEYADIAAIVQSTLQSTLEPLMSKLDAKVDRLEVKVDHLTQDRVTKADVEKIRNELLTTTVPRDSYEARHAALIQRNSDLESRLKQAEDRSQEELQRIHARLESGKQGFEDRFRDQTRMFEEKMKEHENRIETKLKDQQNTNLNDKDRHWVRLSQLFGVIAVIIALLDLLFNHVKFQ